MCGSVLCDLRALLKISVFLLQVRWCVLRVTGAQEAHYRCWEGVIRGGAGTEGAAAAPPTSDVSWVCSDRSCDGLGA